MRVLACGSRDLKDPLIVNAMLDGLYVLSRSLKEEMSVVEGGALGADTLARQWAGTRDVRLLTFMADWEKNGKGAGPIRNREMLTAHPDLVVAFINKPLIQSRGTANMVTQARKAGVRTYVIETP